MEAARFEVSGRVQGVGYRYFAMRAARTLELRGWVRNRADGSVEVAACGSAADLRELERQLRRGPLAARVGKVARLPWPLSPSEMAAMPGFEIAPSGMEGMEEAEESN